MMSRKHHEQEISPWKCLYGIECYCVDEKNIKLCELWMHIDQRYIQKKVQRCQKIYLSLYIIQKLLTSNKNQPYGYDFLEQKCLSSKLAKAFRFFGGNVKPKMENGKCGLVLSHLGFETLRMDIPKGVWYRQNAFKRVCKWCHTTSKYC